MTRKNRSLAIGCWSTRAWMLFILLTAFPAVARAYDHRGLRLRLESSRDSAADIVRNAMGDVSQVSYRDGAHRWSAAFTPDRLGLEVDRVVGSGDTAVRGYWWRDALGRPTQHWVGQASAPEGQSPTSHLRGRRKGLLGVRERLGDDEAWAEALRSAAEDEVFGWLAEELLGELERAPDDAPPEEDEDGVLTWLFEPESFAPLARVSEQRGAMAVFTDHLGTPLCLTDAAGEVAWQGVTDTFGRCEVTEGDAGLCPWRFPGQYEDAETGLFYNRFRYYSAEVGGYVSRDPIGLNGGLAVHGYVEDPTGWVDPLGLTPKSPGTSCGSEFPDDPHDLTSSLGIQPKTTLTKDGTTRHVWEPNADTRIRFESHPEGLSPGSPGFHERHHGEHYHVETKPSGLSWNQAKKKGKVKKAKPPGYTPGSGTGFLPGEDFPT